MTMVMMTISRWSWYCIVLAPVCRGGILSRFNLNTRLEPIGTKSALVTCHLYCLSQWETSFPRRTLSLAFTKLRVIGTASGFLGLLSSAAWFKISDDTWLWCQGGASAPLGGFILPSISTTFWYKWTHYVLTSIGAPSFSDPRSSNNHWDHHSRNVVQESRACGPRSFNWHS